MDISPGLQLVWLLAGRETRLSKMAEIEPEHFFCALLKLAGTSEQHITKLIQEDKNLDALNLLTEQQALIDLFEEQGIESFSIRYDLRKAIGKGDVTEPPDTYHRSFASRRLFRQAERLASEGEDEAMEAQHLLQVLLKHPPSKVKQFIDESAGAEKKPIKRKKVEEDSSEEEEMILLDLESGEEEELYPFMYNLEPEKGFNVPKENQPQLTVLEWALQQSHPLHLLLMCEAGVPVFDIMGKADLSLPTDICIRKIELSGERDALSADSIASELTEVLGHYASENDVNLFADLGESPPAVAAKIITHLEGSLPQPDMWDSELPGSIPVRLILAVDAGLEKEEVMDLLSISDLFRSIWLHQLDFPRHLESV